LAEYTRFVEEVAQPWRQEQERLPLAERSPEYFRNSALMATGPYSRIPFLGRPDDTRRAGIMISHNQEFMLPEAIECVSISKGIVDADYYHSNANTGFFERADKNVQYTPNQNTGSEKQCYSYYNIMWVIRKDGITYRKRLGRVASEYWEKLALEDVDIILA
jgi:hypothetical protein